MVMAMEVMAVHSGDIAVYFSVIDTEVDDTLTDSVVRYQSHCLPAC